jgi:hypothetical protein
VVSYVLIASTALAQKALLIVLPPLSGLTFYRASIKETGARTPSVIGAACYGLSALSLWGFSEGRIPVLVLLAILPMLWGRLPIAFGSSGVRSIRFIAGSAMVLAAGLAFYPGIALALALLVVMRVVLPERGEWLARGTGAIALVAATASLLVLPLAIQLASGSGQGLASTVGRPSFDSLARLAPDGGTGSWPVSFFLPIAALLSFTLIGHRTRAGWRALLASVVGLFLAWAAASGYLPEALSNPVAYLAVAALSLSSLVADGLAEALPEMGRAAFGYRQVAVATVGAVLVGGIGLQAIVAARGDWAVGADKLPPAWPVVATADPGHEFRVLWLGRLSGERFLPPGGDPTGTLSAAGVSVRYGLTGRQGITALDVARRGRGPGYDALENALANVLSGTTRHGGALLAPLGIEYIVANHGDLPPEAERALGSQVDLDLVPAGGLTIYRDPKALAGASITTDPRVVDAARSGSGAAATALPTAHVTRLDPVPGGFAGRPSSKQAETALLTDQFADGWRLNTDGREIAPEKAFGWAISFRVPPDTKEVSIQFGDQWPRRLMVLVTALAWAVGLWLTRRPARA